VWWSWWTILEIIRVVQDQLAITNGKRLVRLFVGLWVGNAGKP
jgi:hypothetical protein